MEIDSGWADDGADRPDRKMMNWPRTFAVIASIMGLAFVVFTPALAGTDEVPHLSRVALIQQGVIIPSTSQVVDKSPRRDLCLDSYGMWYALYASLGTQRGWANQFQNLPCDANASDQASHARAADVYSPVPYAPALVGFGVGRALHGAAGSFYGARLFQLAAYIALMVFAIRRIPWGKPLLFTIGLLPVSLQGAANISADPMTLALACCTVALVLDAIERSRRGPLETRALVVLGCVVAALSLCKSAYLPMALLALAIPTAAFGTFKRRLGAAAAIVGSASVLGGAWNIGVVSHVNIVGVNHSNSVVASRWLQRHPRAFLGAILKGWEAPRGRASILLGFFTPVRRFSRNFPLHVWIGMSWLVIVRLIDPVPRWVTGLMGRFRPVGFGATPAARDPLSTRDRRVSGAIAAIVAATCFLLIEYGLAISANPPYSRAINWVQGRYFLPLLPLTLFGVGSGVPQLSRRRLVAVPIVSSLLLVWWLWWASHNLWHWL